MDERARHLAKRDRSAGIGDQAIRRPGFFQFPGEVRAIGHRADTRCRIGSISCGETPARAVAPGDSKIEPPNDGLTRPAADERADGLATWHRSHKLSIRGSWLCLNASHSSYEDHSDNNYSHACSFHIALRFRVEVRVFAAALERLSSSKSASRAVGQTPELTGRGDNIISGKPR